MHDTTSLQQVTSLVTLLPPEERRQLAETILRDLSAQATTTRRLWREIRGSVPHPLCGEDAQQWVSRGRRETVELEP